MWDLEQQGPPLPLKECPLLDSNSRSTNKALKKKSTAGIVGVWGVCQQRLAPNLSPLVSFLHYPDFWEATSNFDFQRWEQAGMDQIGKFGLAQGIIAEDLI